MKKMLLIMAFVLGATPLALYAYLHARSGHDGKVHIRYMAWGGPEQQATDYAVLQRFEQQHPNIKVEFILVPGNDYSRKLQVMLVSGTEPDVFKMDLYYLPKYFPFGYFRPLDDLAASDPSFSFDDFYPITKNELTYNGKIHGLNTLFGGKLLYYNKSLFKKLGVPDPYEQYKRGEWNLDSFLAAAKAISAHDGPGGAQRFGVKLDAGDLWWIMWAFGGDIIDKNHNVYIDSPASVAALTFYNDLRHKHHVMPLSGEDTGGAFSFESGKLGMFSEYAGASPRLRKIIPKNPKEPGYIEWDVVPVPSGPAGHFSLMKGNGLIISARSKHTAAAWELIKFLNSPEIELAYAGPELRRAIPTRLVVPHAENNGRRIDREAYLSTINPHTGEIQPPLNTETFLDLHASARQLPVTAEWHLWQQAFGVWLDKLHRGVIGPEECARNMARDVRAVLGPPKGPPLVTIAPAPSTGATP